MIAGGVPLGPMTFAPVSVLLAPTSLKPNTEPATSSLTDTRVPAVGSASALASPKVAGAAVPAIVIVSAVLSAAIDRLPLPVSTDGLAARQRRQRRVEAGQRRHLAGEDAERDVQGRVGADR